MWCGLQRGGQVDSGDWMRGWGITSRCVSNSFWGFWVQGLWLVWSFQGERTLAHFMKQKGFPANVAPHILPAEVSILPADVSILALTVGGWDTELWQSRVWECHNRVLIASRMSLG